MYVMVGLVPVLREALDENNEDRIVVRTGTHTQTQTNNNIHVQKNTILLFFELAVSPPGFPGNHPFLLLAQLECKECDIRLSLQIPAVLFTFMVFSPPERRLYPIYSAFAVA